MFCLNLFKYKSVQHVNCNCIFKYLEYNVEKYCKKVKMLNYISIYGKVV